MKTCFSILNLVLLFSLLLVSCSRGFVYKVFNNSGQDLTVVCYDSKDVPTEYHIKAGAFHDVHYPSKLVIKHDKGEWRYDRLQHTSAYEYSRTAGPRVQDVQVEADGVIYLLLPNTKQTVKQFPSQPDGYPLRPK
jgi:hypothetical protein